MYMKLMNCKNVQNLCTRYIRLPCVCQLRHLYLYSYVYSYLYSMYNLQLRLYFLSIFLCLSPFVWRSARSRASRPARRVPRPLLTCPASAFHPLSRLGPSHPLGSLCPSHPLGLLCREQSSHSTAPVGPHCKPLALFGSRGRK
jgi:hypothetical protein